VPAPAGAAVRVSPAMALRIELDFRHGLAEPGITRDEAGEPVLSFAHGQDCVRIALSEHSLRALGLAILTSIGADGC
jgi:hypothetical protein